MCFKCPTPLTEASRRCTIAVLSEARQNGRCFTSHGGECEHSCGSFVNQHCADPVRTTHIVLPTGGGGWNRWLAEERALTRGLPGSSWTVVLRTMTGLEALQHPG